MKILVQHKDTREYVRPDEGWTADRTLARKFKSGHEAVRICAERELTHVQVVYNFPDRHMNFAMPLSDAYLGLLHQRLVNQRDSRRGHQR